MSSGITPTSHPPQISKATVGVISLSGGLGIAAIVMARLAILAVIPSALYASGGALLVSSAVTGILLYKKYSREISSNPVTPSSSNHPSPRSVTNKPYAERIREAYEKRENLQDLIAEAMKFDADQNSLAALKEVIRQSLTAGRTDVAGMISGTSLIDEFFDLAKEEDQLAWAEALMIKGIARSNVNWNDEFCKRMDTGKINYAILILAKKGIDLQGADLSKAYAVAKQAKDQGVISNILDIITGELDPIASFKLACHNSQLAWAQQIAKNIPNSKKSDKEWGDLYTSLSRDGDKIPYAQLILNIQGVQLSFAQCERLTAPPVQEGRTIFSTFKEAQLSAANFRLAYDRDQYDFIAQRIKNGVIDPAHSEWDRLFLESTNIGNFARKHRYAALILDIPDVQLAPESLAFAFGIAFRQGTPVGYNLAKKILGRTSKTNEKDSQLQIAFGSVIQGLLKEGINPTAAQFSIWSEIVITLFDTHQWFDLARQVYRKYTTKLALPHRITNFLSV